MTTFTILKGALASIYVTSNLFNFIPILEEDEMKEKAFATHEIILQAPFSKIQTKQQSLAAQKPKVTVTPQVKAQSVALKENVQKSNKVNQPVKVTPQSQPKQQVATTKTQSKPKAPVATTKSQSKPKAPVATTKSQSKPKAPVGKANESLVKEFLAQNNTGMSDKEYLAYLQSIGVDLNPQEHSVDVYDPKNAHIVHKIPGTLFND